MAAAVDKAHKKGKTVASHAANVESVLASLRAGVDSIEHGLIMNEVCIERLVENGRYYIPTVEIYERIVRYGTEVFASHQVEESEQVVAPHREAFQMAVEAGVKRSRPAPTPACTRTPVVDN